MIYNYINYTYQFHCGQWINPSRIYPKYVVRTGRSFAAPHSHRHYKFDEFIDKLYEDDKFRSVIENK